MYRGAAGLTAAAVHQGKEERSTLLVVLRLFPRRSRLQGRRNARACMKFARK